MATMPHEDHRFTRQQDLHKVMLEACAHDNKRNGNREIFIKLNAVKTTLKSNQSEFNNQIKCTQTHTVEKRCCLTRGKQHCRLGNE